MKALLYLSLCVSLIIGAFLGMGVIKLWEISKPFLHSLTM